MHYLPKYNLVQSSHCAVNASKLVNAQQLSQNSIQLNKKLMVTTLLHFTEVMLCVEYPHVK